ncbi:MAG: hypothetical protein ACK559_20995 [bacterium]
MRWWGRWRTLLGPGPDGFSHTTATPTMPRAMREGGPARAIAPGTGHTGLHRRRPGMP